jgi:hypothetical protein
VAEQSLPSEEELRQALDRIEVSDVLLESATTVVSLGFRRVASETRDLEQVRLAVEALRVLEPVLRGGGVDESVVRDLEQARSNLQLAYASAVSEAASEHASPEASAHTSPGAASEPVAPDAGAGDPLAEPEDAAADGSDGSSRPADADP